MFTANPNSSESQHNDQIKRNILNFHKKIKFVVGLGRDGGGDDF